MAEEKRRPQKYPLSTTVAPDGTAEITFTGPGDPLTVTQVRLTVSTSVSQPTATLYLNGTDYAGSYTGANDTARGILPLASNDTIQAVWTDADPGATARMNVFGYQVIG